MKLRSNAINLRADRGVAKKVMVNSTFLFILGFAITCTVVIAAVTLAQAQDGSVPDGSIPDAAAPPPDQPDASDGSPEAPDGLDAGSDVGDADTSAPAGTALPTEADLPTDQAWIFVDKSERRMVVNDGRGFHETFRVALGQTPEGDKRVEGDGRTPEGEFYVCRRIVHDRYHRFLGINYPSPEDALRGQRARLLQPVEVRAINRAYRNRTIPPWQTPLGGNIGIHAYGRRSDRARLHARGDDWTDGCIAVTNDEIERIHQHIQLGTRVVIVP